MKSQGGVRISMTEMVVYQVNNGLTPNLQIGFDVLAPLAILADAKYRYFKGEHVQGAAVVGAGAFFAGLPIGFAGNAITITDGPFQANVALGGGFLAGPLLIGSMGFGVQLGDHAKVLMEALAMDDPRSLANGSNRAPAYGLGTAVIRFFGDSASVDLGVVVNSDILTSTRDYFPALPMLALSYRTQ